MAMDDWLKAALDYIPRWIEFQMRLTEQPGAVTALAWRGRVVFEQAFGLADAPSSIPPRRRAC
jgi:hypothetical protein